MRVLMIIPAALIAACGPAASTAVQMPVAAPGMVSIPVVRTAQTDTGQPLRLPPGNSEMVATVVEIPAGASTPIHQHPWSRFVYVERGPVRVINEDVHQTREYQTGQAFAEAVAQWHLGQAPGPQGARLVVIDIVPPGVTNMTMR